MIVTITGILYEKNPDSIIIDVNGLGYFCYISTNTYDNLPDLEKEVFLVTYFHVNENNQQLFAFSEITEKELFIQLISVSGVGPSTARMILSTYSAEEIVNYIITADVTSLQNVKGIGGKTAQRIIIDLKDKVGKGKETSDLLFTQDNTIKEEALSALLALGFTKKVAYKKMEQVMKNHEGEITVEDLVRRSLG